MAQNFNRAEVVAGTTRTALYGPVGAGVTSIVFAGTFANIDSSTLQHKITLEVRNAASAYVQVLPSIPVDPGSASKCPKLVLLPGEYLYVTADAAASIQASVQILELS